MGIEGLATDVGGDVTKDVAKRLIPYLWRKFQVWRKYALDKEAQFAKYKETMQNLFEIVNNPVLANSQRKLDDVFHPQTIILENSKEEILIDRFPMDLMKKYKRIIIKDTAGRGKSTLMKKMFLWCVQDGLYPIFVDLRNLKKNHLIIEEILKNLGEYNEKFDILLLQKFIDDGKLIFFFDGFDEVKSEDCTDVAKDIRDFVSRADKNMFVLTSREDDRLAGFASFKGARLKDFTLSESCELIRKYDGYTEKAENIINLLNTGCYEEVKDFLRSPLHTTLFYGAYKDGRAIPIKLHEVCHDIFESLFYIHDLSKDADYIHNKRCCLALSDYERILGCIGRYCLHKGTFEIEDSLMADVLKNVRDQCPGLSFQDDELLYDISISISVFRRKRSSYVWIHETMCHYFMARSLCMENQNVLDKVLTKIYASSYLERYVPMLRIYGELSPMEFRHYFLLELLKEYRMHYLECLKPSYNAIRSDSKELREYLLFGHQIFLVKDETEICVEATPQRLLPLLKLLYECNTEMFSRIKNIDTETKHHIKLESDRVNLSVGSFIGSQEEYDNCNIIVAKRIGEKVYLTFQFVQEKIKELDNFKLVYNDKNFLSV